MSWRAKYLAWFLAGKQRKKNSYALISGTYIQIFELVFWMPAYFFFVKQWMVEWKSLRISFASNYWDLRFTQRLSTCLRWSLTNYVDKMLDFFDHLSCWNFEGIPLLLKEKDCIPLTFLVPPTNLVPTCLSCQHSLWIPPYCNFYSMIFRFYTPVLFLGSF